MGLAFAAVAAVLTLLAIQWIGFTAAAVAFVVASAILFFVNSRMSDPDEALRIERETPDS